MADMMEIIKQISLNAVEEGKPAAVIFGTVVSATPLRIDIEMKQPLQAAHLVLSRNVTDYTVHLTMDHSTEDALSLHSHGYSGETENADGHTHPYSGITRDADLTHAHSYKGKKAFTVHNSLKAGERVVLLRMQGGQKFLVFDRVV